VAQLQEREKDHVAYQKFQKQTFSPPNTQNTQQNLNIFRKISLNYIKRYKEKKDYKHPIYCSIVSLHMKTPSHSYYCSKLITVEKQFNRIINQ
jgi:hypothetical protein